MHVHSFNHLRFNKPLLSSNYISGTVEGGRNAGRYVLIAILVRMIIGIPYFFIQNMISYKESSLNDELIISQERRRHLY